MEVLARSALCPLPTCKAIYSHCEQLFDKQADFFDIPVSTLTPLQVREKLADIAASVLGKEELIAFGELLKHKGSPNGGVAVTDDLKYGGVCQPRDLFVLLIPWSLFSQVLPAERDSRVTHSLVGWHHRSRNFELLGKGRMVEVSC